MNSELIPVFKTDFNTQTVNARDLHQFLEVKAHFKDWIKNKIEQHENFVENQDYMRFANNLAKGRPSQEYYISLSMAKHIAMAEKNQKGYEARNYFEKCEQELMSRASNKLMSTGEFLVEVANNILVHEKMLQQHQNQINNLNSIINYIPLKNFCEEHNLVEITSNKRIIIGKVLSRFCKKYNIPTSNPTSYGKIGSYPRDVIIIYMNKYYDKHFGIQNRIPEIPRFTKVLKKSTLQKVY